VAAAADETGGRMIEVRKGQRWMFRGHEVLGVVTRVTPKGLVIFDPAPKMGAMRKIPIEELVTEGVLLQDQ
jgi:hypothetical protein